MAKSITHAFEGDGLYCDHMSGDTVVGSDEHGTLSVSVQCGYPRSMHPKEDEKHG